MKHLLTLIFFGIYFIASSQSYSFYPKWKKGDTKKITITHEETESKDNIIVSDTTYTSDAMVSVIGEDKDFITIKVLYENVAMVSVIEFYDKLDEELKDYKTLKLIYKINRKTGEYNLTNWKSAQSFMNNSFDQITNLMKEKVPEMEAFAGLIFSPIKEIFKSKENIESYYKDQIGFLFIPFGRKYELGKTISEVESGENPFNPAQEISQTNNYRLNSIDKKSGVAELEYDIELDLDEFVEMLKGMMVSMSKSFGASDSTIENTSIGFDDFDMSMDNKQIILFDLKTTWVTSVISTAVVLGNDGESKSESITTRTFEIK